MNSRSIAISASITRFKNQRLWWNAGISATHHTQSQPRLFTHTSQEPQPKQMHTSTFTTNACETPQHNTTQRITALINPPPENQMCWCSCCACVPDHSKVHSCFLGVVTCSEYRAAYSDVGAAHLDLHSSTARRQQARQQQSNTNISKRNC